MLTDLLKPLPDGGKTIQTAQALSDLARRLGPGVKLPTVRDLCKQLRVSRYTLDTALNDLEIQGLLSRKQGSGLYVAQRAQTRRVGLVLSPEKVETNQGVSRFYQFLLSSLQRIGHQRHALIAGYSYDSNYDKKHGPQQVQFDVENGRVDALITCGTERTATDQIRALGFPCVFCTTDEKYTPRVATRMNTLIAHGVEALVKNGCRRIGFAYGVAPDHASFQDYLDVFQQYLREYGADADYEWLMPFDVIDASFRSLEASRCFHDMWANSSQRPDGLLSLDDQYTSGVLHAMEVLGVRSPDELLVVSHANKGIELFGEIEVIRLEYDPDEIANLILDVVDGLLAGETVPEEQIVSHRIYCPKALDSGLADQSSG